jgi:hypothetical protein
MIKLRQLSSDWQLCRNMEKTLLFLLLTLGLSGSVRATSVNYAEAYYSVPEYMTEVPADGVHGYDANPAARSFLGRDPNGQVFILVSSYRDTSQIKDEKAWAAVASAPEQQLIQEIHAHFAPVPSGTTVTIESAKADLRAHKIVSVVTISDSGTVSKLVTAILAVKNQKSLHLEIYVDRNRFEELFVEMMRIVDSLAANPDFQL